MAFRFFRRRQRLMMIIMAALMVSFLIGGLGFRALFDSGREKTPVGTAGADEITIQELREAASTIQVLGWFVGLGDPRRGMPGDLHFLRLQANERPELALALLIKEARDADVRVGEVDFRTFLTATNRAGAEYESMMATFRSRARGTEKQLRAAVEDWIRVEKAYQAAVLDTPVSEPELKRLYRDLQEKISLRILKVSAEPLVEQVGQPTADELRAQFLKHRGAFAGQDRSVGSFGFGYKQPDRVRIHYLLINRETLRRVSRPTDEQIGRFYRQNKAEFVREVSTADARQTAEVFLRAAADKAQHETTRRLSVTDSDVAKQVDLFEQLKDSAEARIVSVHADGLAAIAVSSPIEAGRKGKAAAVIRLIRREGEWLVEEIAVRPVKESKKLLSEFLRKHPKAGPVPAAGDKSAATQPIRYRREQLPLSKVRGRIVEELRSGVVDRGMGELMARATALARKFAQGPGGGRGVYESVRSAMTLPAKALLAGKVRAVRIDNERIDRAVEMLAEAANLEAICFPFSRGGKQKLDASVRVSLSASGISLGEAIKRLCAKVKWPEPKWATCLGLDSVLFPVGRDVEQLFPVSAGTTGLLDGAAVSAHEILGRCYTSPRGVGPLRDVAFSAIELVAGRGRRVTSLIKVGDDGPQMYVVGPEGGRLLWRLLAVTPARQPKEMSQALRKQIVRDIKIRRAFARAVKQADAIRAEAARIGLAAAAKKRKLETELTGLLARRRLIFPRRQLFYLLLTRGISGPRALRQIALQEPVSFVHDTVKNVDLPTAAHRELFLTAAFSLTPREVEPPYPSDPPAVAAVELPINRQVVVMQRVEYRPPVVGEYQKDFRLPLARTVRQIHLWRGADDWFDEERIKKRLAFQPIRGR